LLILAGFATIAENPGNVALAKWRFLVRDSRRAGCFVGVWAIAIHLPPKGGGALK
jgi:hypothetical protein